LNLKRRLSFGKPIYSIVFTIFSDNTKLFSHLNSFSKEN